MNIPTKKLSDGFEMPVFGLGTWRMGGAMTRDPQNDDQADITAIKNAIEVGITHIDTAEKYAEGHAEELVGQAIKGYDRRNLFLVTKIPETKLGYKDILTSITASLERLQTDYVDMYMIHGPSMTTPIEETMKALDEVTNRGFTKNIAVSNFTVDRLQKAQAASRHKIVAGQYHFNLSIREAERKGVVKYFQDNDMMLIAWRPIQKGYLAKNMFPIMEKMCRKYGKTSSQIAINWLISQKNIVTLSKMNDHIHLKENLGALGWQMEKEDIEKLNREFPGQQDISDAVPLLD